MTRWGVPADPHPVGKLVAERIAVVEEAALLHQEAAGVRARPAGHPADGALARQPFQPLDGAADMLALDLLGHMLVVEPAPAVADDLMAAFDDGLGRIGVALQPHDHSPDAGLYVAFLEDAHEPPEAAPAAVFEGAFHDHVAHALVGREARIRQHTLRMGIAVEDAVLAACLVVDGDGQAEIGSARPLGVRRPGAVAHHVTRIGCLRSGHVTSP